MLAMFGKDAYELRDMLTVEDWDLRQNAMVDKPRDPIVHTAFWQTRHKSSGLTVTIRRRSDRQPQITLFHGKLQICQVPLMAFCCQIAAVNFMTLIGEKFALDLLPKDQVYQFRNELAKHHRICFSKPWIPFSAAVTGSSEAAWGSATSAVTGLSKAARGSATAAVTGSSESAYSSSKRTNIVSGSPKRKCARTDTPVVDEVVIERKFGAAKVCNTLAAASLEGKHEGDVEDVDDDDVESDCSTWSRMQ
jgi:hypothetical protein